MNCSLDTNFFAFVNGYRIEYSISIIRERQGDITSDIIVPLMQITRQMSAYNLLFRS